MVCEVFALIEKEADAVGGKRVRSTASGAFLVAINEKAEAYWLAVPSIEFVFMNKIELALWLGIEPDTQKYEQKISRGHGMRI